MLAASLPPPGFVAGQARLRPGEALRFGLEAKNPLGEAAALYRLGEPVSLADASRYRRAATAPPGFALTAPAFAELPLPAGAPAGTDRVVAFFWRQRAALGAGSPPEDFLASALRDIAVSP